MSAERTVSLEQQRFSNAGMNKKATKGKPNVIRTRKESNFDKVCSLS